MKIELFYAVTDEDGKKIKEFLIKNNLPFKEYSVMNKISSLKITYSHAIHIIDGFNELALKQLLEHIEKYSQR